MENPSAVSAELARLQPMIGTWRADVTIPPGPWGDGGPSSGSSTVDWKGGIWLACDFVCDMPQLGKYYGLGMMTWVPEISAYRFYWFSNGQTAVPVVSGAFVGDELILTGANEMMGTTFHEKHTYTFLADGSWKFRIELSQDGSNFFDTFFVHYRTA